MDSLITSMSFLFKIVTVSLIINLGITIYLSKKKAVMPNYIYYWASGLILWGMIDIFKIGLFYEVFKPSVLILFNIYTLNTLAFAGFIFYSTLNMINPKNKWALPISISFYTISFIVNFFAVIKIQNTALLDEINILFFQIPTLLLMLFFFYRYSINKNNEYIKAMEYSVLGIIIFYVIGFAAMISNWHTFLELVSIGHNILILVFVTALYQFIFPKEDEKQSKNANQESDFFKDKLMNGIKKYEPLNPSYIMHQIDEQSKKYDKDSSELNILSNEIVDRYFPTITEIEKIGLKTDIIEFFKHK